MLRYYSTTLHWGGLVNIKAKHAVTPLTQMETDFRRYCVEDEMNVLQLIYLFLKAVEHIEDKRGKLIYLRDYQLPVA